LFLGGQPADAAREDKLNFQDFRSQNTGIDRHLARQLFKDQRQNERHNDRQNNLQNFARDRVDLRGIAGGDVHQNLRSNGNHLLNFAAITTQSLKNANPSFQLNEQGRLVRLSTGINLDLLSQDKNIVLGEKLFAKTDAVEVVVGGETKTFSAGAQVTASEYVAVKQVLEGLPQSIVLNGNGQATSGDVNLSALTEKRDVMRAANLVVPVDVTALADFSKGSDFRLLGDLDNYGTVEALADSRGRNAASSGNGRGGAIRAEDINNYSGATITANGDLTLSAAGMLTNDGTITSAQNLNLEAANVKNTGSISAARNIRIDTPQGSPQVLNIDNNGGTIAAGSSFGTTGSTTFTAGGDINIRTAAYQGSADTNLFGGNVLSKNLNLFSGTGTVNINVNELTGSVNSQGTAAHVTASTGELNIGETCLTGDPTFYNTAGAININGSITVAEALAIIATGNIIFNNGADLTAANNTQGFPISVIAGANFTPTGGANQGTLGPIPPANPNSGSVTINGGSAGGGSISFNSSAGIDTFISTRPAGGSGSAGDVTLVAFQGAAAGSGRINTGLPTFDRIFAGGKTNGSNGNVTIIAPDMNSGGTFLPQIDNSGGNGAPGNITVVAAAPIANNVVYNNAGVLVTAPITPSASTSPTGEVRFAQVNAGKGSLYARGFLVQMSGNTPVSARKITVDSTGAVNLFSNITATSLFQVTAAGQVNTVFGSTAGQVNSPLSILTSTSNSIGTPAAPFLLQSGGTVIADGATGVSITSPVGINLGGGSTKTGDFVVATAGNTSITGAINLGVGNIDVSTTSGQLSAGAVSISTGLGNISLTALGTDKKTTKLILTGTQISAVGSPAFGDITLGVGPLGSPVLGKTPKKNVNISINGGQIFFGAKGLTTLAPTNFLSTNNADIVFNNPYSKKNIVLSGVTLVADP